ncbi:Leukocyte surface antigen CD47, partial [Eschrichtius robustus]|nr:Leukocyte surface antigen CD47 [Eschrichtius robustus]
MYVWKLFLSSAQLIFNTTKSVEYTVCNQTVVIPCFVNNMEAKSIAELYVKWKFKGKDIFNFDGGQQKSKPSDNFTSAKISPSELLNGIASLTMDKRDAVLGNYTCEVTELSREGETIVELKYRVVEAGKGRLEQFPTRAAGYAPKARAVPADVSVGQDQSVLL